MKTAEGAVMRRLLSLKTTTTTDDDRRPLGNAAPFVYLHRAIALQLFTCVTQYSVA